MNLLSIVAPSLFLSLTLFFFGPSQIFFTNSKEFYFIYGEAAPYFLTISTSSFVLISGILLFLKNLKSKKPFKIFLSFIFVLGFLLWFQGNVLVWNYGLLDGKPIIWKNLLYRSYIDIFIWVLLLAIAVIKHELINKYSKKIALFLIIIQITYTLILGLKAGEPASYKKYVIDESNKFTFSDKKNVIILLLDTLESDIFAEVLAEKKEYQEIFDGFSFYPDTLSSYPYTFLSIPSILTGKQYKNQEPILEFLKNSYTKESLFTRLKENGFRTEVYTGDPITLYFDDKLIDNLVPRKRNLLSGSAAGGVAYLSDIVMFRYFPSGIKKYIYNDQKWQLSNQENVPKASYKTGQFGQRSINFVKNLEERTKSEDISPVFKFYHLRATHPPYELTEDLKIKEFDLGTPGYKEQIRAMLTLIKSFLNKLKEEKVYDNSLVIILADHGAGVRTITSDKSIIDHGEEYYGSDIPNLINKNVQKRGIPLLLIKPINSRGQLKINSFPASLTDTPKTVTDYLGVRNTFKGVSMLSEKKVDVNRKRTFFQYDLENENIWKEDYFTFLKEYTVSGNSWFPSSWEGPIKIYLAENKSKDILPTTYKIGERINFKKNGNNFPYQMGGWSNSEGTLTWTDDQVATLRLNLLEFPKKNVILKFKGMPFLKQNMNIYVNEEQVSNLLIEENKEYEIEVDKQYFKQKEIFISFELPNARQSPYELGINNEERKLGVAFEYLQLTQK